MSKIVDHVGEQLPSAPDLGIVAPLSNRVLFWPARFLKPDPILHQLPLLFWLLDALRPRSFVSLGGPTGVGHFAACQALDKLDCDAVCHALGPWPDNTVPEEIVRYNDSHFPDISQVSTGKPETWARRFAKRGIDFLLIDQQITRTLAEKIEKVWLPRLSDNGVLMLHGLNDPADDAAADDLLDRLHKVDRTFELDTGAGVLLVLPGKKYPDRVEALVKLSVGAPGYSDVQRVMSRLGRLHHMDAVQRDLADEARQANEKLSEAEAAQTAQADKLAALREKLREMDAAYDQRNQQLALVQAKIFDVEQNHRQTRSAAQEALEQLQQSHATLTAEQESLLHDMAGLKEIAAAHETLVAQHTALAAERDSLQTAQAALAAERAGLEDALRATQQNQSLIESRVGELQGLLETRKAETVRLKEEHAQTLQTLKERLDAALADKALAQQGVTADQDAWKARETELSKELEETHEKAAKNLERLETRKREVEELKGRRSELQKQLTEAQQTLAARDSALTEAQQTLAARDSALTEAQQTLAARDSALAEAQQTLATRDSALTEAQQTLATRDSALAEAQTQQTEARQVHFTETSLLTGRLETTVAERDTLQTACADLTRAQDQRFEELALLTGRLETTVAERDALQTACVDLTRAQDQRFEELALLTGRLETLTAAEAVLRDQLDTARLELAQLVTLLERREADAAKAETRHDRELKTLRKTLATTERALAAHDKTIKGLRSDMTALRKTHSAEIKTRKARQDAEIDDLRNSHGRAVASLRARMQGAEAQLRAAETRAATEATAHADEQQQRFDELAGLTRRLETQEHKLLEAETTIRREAETSAHLNRVLSEIKDAQKHQSIALRQRNQELASLQETRRQLDAQLAERDTALATLTEAHQQLTAQHNILNEQIDGILRSNSWKITAPVRRIIDSARGSGS